MKLSFALFLAVFTLLCTCVRAQTTADNFEDGDLLNPEWTGDADKFVVENGRLRLADASREGPARLVVQTPVDPLSDTVTFEFLVDMDFSPSGSNYAEVAIIGRDNGQGGPEQRNQIFLRFGGISGDQDALTVRFFGIDVVIGEITGMAGALGQSPAIVRWRLQGINGDWRLAADYNGARDFMEQDSFLRMGFSVIPERFELHCNYTATRSDKFSFDDLNVTGSGAPADDTPPVLREAEVVDARNLRLRFSEAVTEIPLNDAMNYGFSTPGLGVATATVNGGVVDLILDDDLPVGQTVTLTITEARDQAGNTATDLTADLLFELLNRPTATNVIINEFLPDPNPVVGLPEVEYLELYNPSDTTVDLSGLGVASGGNPVTISEGRLPARGHVVLVPAANQAAFAALGARVIPFNLPGLSNSSDEITLSFGGETLQEINYTDDWYNDPERDNGGYSLEFTGGADAGCSGRWRASLDPSGGTPGRANSVLNNPADTEGPGIITTDIDPDGITIGFSEPISGGNPNFTLDNGLTVASVVSPDGGQTFRLGFNEELAEGVIYTLTVPGLSDCVGNATTAREIRLALPGEPAVGDVVINEILFNPLSGGKDFLELYNCSDKVFQIEDWVLRNDQSESTTSAERTITASRLFLPGEYLTLTEDPDDLIARYREVNPELLVDQRLPSLPNDAGNISVIAGGLTLDAFDYEDDLHSDLLDSDDGVSLERLRFKNPSQNIDNWYSAAASEDFATPTRPNSQNRDALPPAEDQIFSLTNTTFSPDGDSNEDFLELRYLTDAPGFAARVRIFDAQGRLIRTLRRVELLAGEGTILWDGANDDGQRARTGVYVLYVELFAPGEGTREEKLVGVLAI